MIFNQIKKHNPEKIALRDESQVVRYGDLNHEINKRIAKLNGVTVLAISFDNTVEWILWDLAAMKAAIPCIPLPPFFTNDQILHSLQSAGVTHILSQDGLRNTSVRERISLPEGTAKITFTSGTTGSPKGVCLTRHTMENVAQSIVDVLGDEFVGNHVSILPLAVLLENVAGVYAALMAGCTITLPSLESFGQNYESIHNLLKDSNATSVILVPEMLRILIAQVLTYGPLPALKFIAVGGSKIDPNLVKQAHAMNLPVYEGYGLSECASVVSLNTPKDHKIGSVGKILPHLKATIVDGEIHVKNLGFLGYVGENAPLDLNTGDLGDIDGDGFLSVTGRKKNVLITSYGRNVSPEWVESILLARPEIAQVIVYGDAQPHLSALIVPSSVNANVPFAVKAINQNLPDYARINNFRIVPPFTVADSTLTGTGRPRRKEILNLYTQENTNEFLQQAY